MTTHIPEGQVTPERVVTMMMDFIQDMDEAEKNALAKAKAEAEQHYVFITAYANAWREVQGPNREYREAIVDDVTKEERMKYEVAKDESKVAFQHIQNVRQKLSALQSASRTVAEEAAFSRTGPNLEGEVESFGFGRR